jgi:anaerobic selenocysteine-containing dehydrogenase
MANKQWQWQEGEYTVTRASAWSGPGCHDGCGVLLYTKDGQLVKVEGDPDDPFNQGRLCVRCLDVRDVTNHPDRIKYPMKRVGEKGKNHWQRISWDEAYDTIETKFNEIKQKYGAESVLFAQGTGRDIAAYIDRLSSSFGSPNHTCLGLTGNACYLPRTAQLFITQGSFAVADCAQYFPDRYDNPNYKVPETMVIWGNNPLVSNPDGFFGHWVVDLMKKGTKLIVIDPRLTWLASRADLWLQIRPGTDAALALGMANVIINEELYDKEFVDKWTYGFDQFKERAEEFPPERVAEITWIPKDKIVEAARLYAKSKPASIQWGLAVDMTKEGLPAAHAISNLWAITGNLDVPGGNITTFPPYNAVMGGYAGEWGYDELLSEEQKEKRIGLKKYPILGHGFLMAQPDELVDQMITGKPYPMKAAWFQTNNAIACMGADPRKLDMALKKLDFVVVVDLFMTPTAMAYADIVLPAATYPERDGIRALWYYIKAVNKVTQIGEAKSDMEINLELGKRFNPQAWPWANVQEMFSDMIKESGVTFQELREKGPLYPPFEYRKYEKGLLRFDGEPGFNTPTGKVELASTFFKDWSLDPVPYFEEPTESPYSTPMLYEQYPLVLTTGARPWGFFHSEQRQVPTLRELHPDPTVEIHPETAKRLGVIDGEWVWIENRMGRCKQRVKVAPILDPRVVNADHAWWFPEKSAEEPSLYGVFESNINQLVPYLPGRSGFGGNYKSLLCKIYKVKEGE